VVKLFQANNVVCGNSTNCGCIARERRAAILRGRRRPGIQTNLYQLYRTYQRKAQKRALAFELTQEQFFAISQLACHYCGAAPSNYFELRYASGPQAGQPRCGEGFAYNGIDRKDNALGYVTSNCVPCCADCNKAKATRSLPEFAIWVRQLAKRVETWAKEE
jgi:hypothetical protein